MHYEVFYCSFSTPAQPHQFSPLQQVELQQHIHHTLTLLCYPRYHNIFFCPSSQCLST
ncbi:hypothetical protein M378DRAFT_309878 [Amanita muscaria Koide BX008]|uniref:Uncharacterized protein n=1 Tax=Amanita muscaria (strain Koide BX008) TaxID=946122 RepID=A0A0C2WPM6_AMAMK|nr:hypothetical protein M378DRAFT_309878 [Amanita muscaria Koide BX008]